ncbi:hypothetical protein GOP47_0023411 [Adiantum capillus-veneris]|uniref:Uncharacterized protein n=1 Tax=Adiantum capillus-veneris TaxID=13818 RepID=A0A9D4U3F9_ADICA|nr:hypothetical protein GOP47_0023411 [Adiantum capillus-veneris]
MQWSKSSSKALRQVVDAWFDFEPLWSHSPLMLERETFPAALHSLHVVAHFSHTVAALLLAILPQRYGLLARAKEGERTRQSAGQGALLRCLVGSMQCSADCLAISVHLFYGPRFWNCKSYNPNWYLCWLHSCRYAKCHAKEDPCA